MKRLSIIFFFYFIDLQTSSARHFENLKICLNEHGLLRNKLVKREIGGSNINSLDRDPDVDSKEKLACTLACSFRKEHSGNETLHAIFTEALNFGNFHILEDVKQQMRETLNNCYTAVDNNDCKLLHCINIIESQFMDVVVTITNDRLDRFNTNTAKKLKKSRFRIKWFKVMHMMIRSLQRHIHYRQDSWQKL